MGLSLFTESEMLQIEKSILESVSLDSSSRDELLKIDDQKNPKKKIESQLIVKTPFLKLLKILML